MNDFLPCAVFCCQNESFSTEISDDKYREILFSVNFYAAPETS